MEQYRRPLEQYNRAHDTYAAAASAYWSVDLPKNGNCAMPSARAAKRLRSTTMCSISRRSIPGRRGRAIRSSRKCRRVRPTCRSLPIFSPRPNNEFKFIPRLPQTDEEFKRAYAAAALAAGLTKNQVVRIYSFEATGNGSYDVEAGLEYNKHAPRDHDGARLQSVVGDQLGRDRGRIR